MEVTFQLVDKGCPLDMIPTMDSNPEGPVNEKPFNESELREELAIEARIGEQLASYDFRYPAADRATSLLFFKVTEFEGEPKNLEFEQIVWEVPSALPSYNFLEGDMQFVAKLAENSNR